jgi:hypothetical protein
LTAMPPGPDLAVALASVDLGGCDSADLYRLSTVRARQIAYEEAQLVAVTLRAVCVEQAEARRRRQAKAGTSLPDPEADVVVVAGPLELTSSRPTCWRSS